MRDERELEVAIGIDNAVLPAEAVTLEDVRSYIEAAPEQEHFLAWREGEPAGAGSVAIEPSRPLPLVRLTVPAPHRRRGVGSALFAAVSTWAGERGHRELETWVDDDQPDGHAFARNRRFVEVGREVRLTLELAAVEPAPVEPPPGIEIMTWASRPELARGLYEVACEASPDIPGSSHEAMEPFEDWLAHDMGGSGDRPEATFVAVAGEEVVGYSKFSLTEAQPTTAFHDLTAVKRAWRSRGIATALKAAQITWAKDNGYIRLVTNNEERNVPIRKLNERFGYAPSLGRTLLRGPISGGS